MEGYKLCIEKIAIERVTLDEDFSFEELYNDNRGGVFKNELKYLISEGISKGLITIEKFVIDDIIQEELLEIMGQKGHERNLLNRLKDYHNEPEELAPSIVYILKRLDPNFALTKHEDKLKIVSDLYEVEICPRIDGRNAEPRLFLTKEKVAIISTNEDITSLADILAAKDITVYAIDVDSWENVMYAYKISRDDRYFDSAADYMKNVQPEQVAKLNKHSR